MHGSAPLVTHGFKHVPALLQGGLGRGAGFAAELSPAHQAALSKVVLARRSDVTFSGELDPLALLEALQERDPRAYQVRCSTNGTLTRRSALLAYGTAEICTSRSLQSNSATSSLS